MKRQPVLSKRSASKWTILQLVGAGLVAVLVACVVVVLMFKKERSYICNNTFADRQTIDIFGLVISDVAEENDVSRWVRSVYSQPLDNDWHDTAHDGAKTGPVWPPRGVSLRALYTAINHRYSEKILRQLIAGPSNPTPEFQDECYYFAEEYRHKTTP